MPLEFEREWLLGLLAIIVVVVAVGLVASLAVVCCDAETWLSISPSASKSLRFDIICNSKV